MNESLVAELLSPELSYRDRIAIPAVGRESLKKPVPVFAITSGKGGVGKTNLVANLAVALARLKKRVLVIDADLGLANQDLFLGVRPQHTLGDFFAGAATLDDILVTNPDGVWLLPGASGIEVVTALRNDQKVALLTELDALTEEFDVVLVDTGSGISDAVTYFATAAQEIIVVVTPEPSSITDAYALIKVLVSGHRQNRFVILTNGVADEREGRQVFDTLSSTALRFLNTSIDYWGSIPRDPSLMWSVAHALPVVRAMPESPSAQAIVALARDMVESGPAHLKIKGNLQFFFRRMLEGRKGA